METAHDNRELDDVLDAYMAGGDTPSHERLAQWARRYPHYARELTEFTAAWSAMAWLPPATAPGEEAALMQRGMQTVSGIVRERVMRRAPETIGSLLEEGRARGLAVDALAERAGLSIPLVLKLDRRLIRFATLPGQAVESVASAIGRDVATVAAYLQAGPRLAAGASYHAAQAPALAGQEDFADAVRADLTLSDERRALLLALQHEAE